ncbi:MAG: hypothetical protein OQJ74_06995 [Ignavibacteriaceae bacterium]|nr:hypothetical protein [Ignavibacteriaceae bacterium]
MSKFKLVILIRKVRGLTTFEFYRLDVNVSSLLTESLSKSHLSDSATTEICNYIKTLQNLIINYFKIKSGG